VKIFSPIEKIRQSNSVVRARDAGDAAASTSKFFWTHLGKIWSNLGKIWENLGKIYPKFTQKHKINLPKFE